MGALDVGGGILEDEEPGCAMYGAVAALWGVTKGEGLENNCCWRSRAGVVGPWLPEMLVLG